MKLLWVLWLTFATATWLNLSIAFSTSSSKLSRCVCISMQLSNQPVLGSTSTGVKFILLHPLTTENALLGVGGASKGRGGIYNCCRGGASKSTPPLLPWKVSYGQTRGGGGVHNFSLQPRVGKRTNQTAWVTSSVPSETQTKTGETTLVPSSFHFMFAFSSLSTVWRHSRKPLRIKYHKLFSV